MLALLPLLIAQTQAAAACDTSIVFVGAILTLLQAFEMHTALRCVSMLAAACNGPAEAVCLRFRHSSSPVYAIQVKKDMLSLYHKYAPIWEKEEVERSERWDAFLAHFETMYQQTEPDL